MRSGQVQRRVMEHQHAAPRRGQQLMQGLGRRQAGPQFAVTQLVDSGALANAVPRLQQQLGGGSQHNPARLDMYPAQAQQFTALRVQ